MKRREALKKTTWILKSTIMAPGVLLALQRCREEAPVSSNLRVLGPAQEKLVQAISDTIFPSTDSPSASDVQVTQFMDLLLQDVFVKEVRQQFLQGMEEFDGDCRAAVGSSFVDLSQEARNGYLQKVDQEVMNQKYQASVPFYYSFKVLTTTIYFTTEEGVKQNLDYQPVPGPYKGDLAYRSGDKIMVGNNM